MAIVGKMANITKITKVSEKTPTLRISIPLELIKELGYDEGDSLIWFIIEHDRKKGLFARKVE